MSHPPPHKGSHPHKGPALATLAHLKETGDKGGSPPHKWMGVESSNPARLPL